MITITDDQMFGDLMMRPAGRHGWWPVIRNAHFLSMQLLILFVIPGGGAERQKSVKVFPPSS